MPTDDDVDGLFAAASKESGRDAGAPSEYDAGIIWEEFHMTARCRCLIIRKDTLFET